MRTDTSYAYVQHVLGVLTEAFMDDPLACWLFPDADVRRRLERADADRLPAYLEAGSPRSRALYLRHGFDDLGDPVQVADSAPVWPMWRAPNR